MKNYESLDHALDDLRAKGYTTDFTTDKVCLYCGELDIRLDPEDFHVDEVSRVEGASGYEDKAFVYAITAVTGVKGTLIDANGTYAQHLNTVTAENVYDQHATLTDTIMT